MASSESKDRRQEIALSSLESYELGALVLEHAPFGVFLYRDYRFLYVNQRAAEVFDRGLEELRSLKTVESLIFAPDYARVLDWFTRLFDGQADLETCQFSVVGRDASTRSLLGSGRRVFHQGLPAILGMLFDASEWLEAQRRLERARRLSAIGQVADTLANDLNNFLGAILGNACLLREREEITEASLDALRDVETGALQASELVAKLSSLSLCRTALKRPLDLNRAAERAVEVLNRSAARHLTLRFRPSPVEALIEGDAAQIEELVLQLGLNACEATPEGGTIEIEVSSVSLEQRFCRIHPEIEPGSFVRLRVEDTGRGIAPEHIEQAFDPFFTTKPRGRGAGIGLALAHNLARLHGGAMDVRSELGKGTQVIVYIPAVEVTARAATPEPVRSATPAFQGAQILVIDDEQLSRSTTARILERAGFIALQAESGQDGLAILRASPGAISLVILDLIMPGLSGRQTLQQIRAFTRDLPVILFTGFSADAIDKEMRDLGAQGLLRKPFRPSDLLAAVDGALRQRNTSGGERV